MGTLVSNLEWLSSTTMLPGTVLLVQTAVKWLKSKDEPEKRRKLRIPLLLLAAYGVLQAGFSAWRIGEWGLESFLSETILISLFLGVPLLALTIFIPAFIRYLRCPKDAPERQQYRRVLRITGVICGILAAVFVAFMIWFAIGIAHM